MKELIYKTDVMAKIDARITSLERIGSENYLHDNYSEQYAMLVTLKSLKFDINTLESKKVDLEKEIKDYFNSQPIITRSKGIDYRLIPTGVDIAKYFFELGLKAQKEE